MRKIDKTQKRILYVIAGCIVVVLILLLSRFAYAYLGADIDADVITESAVTANGDTLVFTKDATTESTHKIDSSVFNLGTSNYVMGEFTPSVTLTDGSLKDGYNASTTYYVGVKINTNTFQYSSGTTPELILSITDPEGNVITTMEGLNYTTANGVSGFDVTTQKGIFTVSDKFPISTADSSSEVTKTWKFKLTFVNYSDFDQSINETASFNMSILLQKDIPTS